MSLVLYIGRTPILGPILDGKVFDVNFTIPEDAEPGTVYDLKWDVIDFYSYEDNLGDAPNMADTVTKVNGKITVEGGKEDMSGDANGDGKLNVRDAAFIANMLSFGMADKLPASADFNKDSKVNVRDCAAIAKFLAKGK